MTIHNLCIDYNPELCKKFARHEIEGCSDLREVTAPKSLIEQCYELDKEHVKIMDPFCYLTIWGVAKNADDTHRWIHAHFGQDKELSIRSFEYNQKKESIVTENKFFAVHVKFQSVKEALFRLAKGFFDENGKPFSVTMGPKGFKHVRKVIQLRMGYYYVLEDIERSIQEAFGTEREQIEYKFSTYSKKIWLVSINRILCKSITLYGQVYAINDLISPSDLKQAPKPTSMPRSSGWRTGDYYNQPTPTTTKQSSTKPPDLNSTKEFPHLQALNALSEENEQLKQTLADCKQALAKSQSRYDLMEKKFNILIEILTTTMEPNVKAKFLGQLERIDAISSPSEPELTCNEEMLSEEVVSTGAIPTESIQTPITATVQQPVEKVSTSAKSSKQSKPKAANSPIQVIKSINFQHSTDSQVNSKEIRDKSEALEAIKGSSGGASKPSK
jgi:hypothetical protein